MSRVDSFPRVADSICLVQLSRASQPRYCSSRIAIRGEALRFGPQDMAVGVSTRLPGVHLGLSYWIKQLRFCNPDIRGSVCYNGLNLEVCARTLLEHPRACDRQSACGLACYGLVPWYPSALGCCTVLLRAQLHDLTCAASGVATPQSLYNKYFNKDSNVCARQEGRGQGRDDPLDYDFFLVIFMIIGSAAGLAVVWEMGTSRIRDRTHVAMRGHGIIECINTLFPECIRPDGSIFIDKLITHLEAAQNRVHHETRDALLVSVRRCRGGGSAHVHLAVSVIRECVSNPCTCVSRGIAGIMCAMTSRRGSCCARRARSCSRSATST
jgi:hypothetical protein